MIILLRVYFPDIIFSFNIICDIFYSRHCGKHGMILVIITMHTVPADQKQVLKFIGELSDFIKLIITSKISRISFGHPDNNTVQDIFFLNQIDFTELIDRKFRKIFVFHSPQFITFVAEIFQSYPYGIFILNHIRTPVVKYLDATDVYGWLLDI